MRQYLPHVLVISLVASLGAALSLSSCGEEASTPSGGGETPSDDGVRTHGLTAEQARQVAVTVGDTEITVGEVAEELAQKASFVRTRYNSPERRREFLDQMVRFELLAQEAERRGYHELPEVQRARKQLMIRRFLEQRFESGGEESIPIEDVRAYYEAHQDEYHTPQQVRASHILFRDRASAQRVLAEVRGAEDDLRLYRQLADQHNTDPATRDRYGDLRFFARTPTESENEPPVPEAVREAAFSIELIGGVYPTVVQSPMGFHIVKLTGRRAASHRSLEAATPLIRNRLWRERREAAIQALIDELRAEADVEENFELLDQIRLDLPESGSPAITPPGTRPPNPIVPPGAAP